MLRSVSIVMFLLSCFARLSAQQLYFTHLGVNNGLSQGVNNCVYKDSRGFVWISSFDGLNRFDGIKCISFRSSVTDSSGLRGTLFLNILEDKKGNLWIGSNEGLNYYDRQTDHFQNFSASRINEQNQFYSPFYIDDEENIWLQSHDDILIFNPNKKLFKQIYHFVVPGNLLLKPYPAVLFQQLQQIIAISNNQPVIWEGTVEKDKINWSSTSLAFPGLRISSLLYPYKNALWLGTNKGILVYRNNQQPFFIQQFQQTAIQDVSALHIDRKGTLWAGTLKDGLYKIDTAKRIATDHFSSSAYNNYSLMGNQVQNIYTDANDNLWVSIWGKGVDFTSLSKFRFTHHLTKEEVVQTGNDNFIRSIVQQGNEFWCGTQTGGILILDEHKKIKTALRKGLPPSIEHLSKGPDGNIWAATFDGLYIINPLTHSICKLPANDKGYGTASNQYNYLSSLPNGSMLASSNAGMHSIQQNGNKVQFTLLPQTNAKEVYLTTFTDSRNQLYISKAFKGFSIYKFVRDSLTFLKEIPIQASIKCFTETPDSTLWIGSTIGLLELNKYTFVVKHIYSTKDGLSNQYIYGIVQDGDYLWLSTNAGINRFHTKTKKVKQFVSDDGLQSNEYNTYSFCKSADGEILFGGVNGLNSFYPSLIKSAYSEPQLQLTGLQINDAPFIPSVNQTELKELTVEYGNNTISLQFTAIDFPNAAANSISYTLDGFDKSWATVANKSFIRYANLPPGSYTLKVKAQNADGYTTKTMYMLPITVATPWWQSWWFRTMAAVALVALILLSVWYYTNSKLEKQKLEMEKREAIEKERNRISQDVHDDMGSGLTKIAILSEVVKKQLAEPEKAKEQLEKIAGFSRELVDNLQDIIWVLNPKNDTLESLSSYIREYGLKYFEPLAVQVKFNYPEHFANKVLSEEQRRNIYMTVKESFTNIAKHAWSNEVTVTIAETSNEILLAIADDGKGFDVSKVRVFANGLKNMQNRIEQIGGSYNISSVPGNGTLTAIRLPV